MFEGALQVCAPTKFPLMLMGGSADCQTCADMVAKTPIGVRGNLYPNKINNSMG